MTSPLDFLKEETILGTYLLSILFVGVLFLVNLFAFISLGQLGPTYQQATNAAAVYAFGFNLVTLAWIGLAFATRNNPQSFFKFIGFNLKAPFWVALFFIGVVFGFLLSPIGHGAVQNLLTPPAATTAASPDVITSVFFQDFSAPFSETFFIVGVVSPFLYWIFGGRSDKIQEKIIAFVAAIVISSSIITVMHVVIYSAALGSLPGLFVFFSLQSILAFLVGDIAIALGMHFGLNLAIPAGLTMENDGIEYVFEPSMAEKIMALPCWTRM